MAEDRTRPPDPVERCAREIHSAYRSFRAAFDAITGRARQRFERRDWRGVQQDALERLALYPSVIRRLKRDLRESLGGWLSDTKVIRPVKQTYATLLGGDPDVELARTFFNSVTRSLFTVLGVNPDIEFLSLHPHDSEPGNDSPIIVRHPGGTDTRRSLLRILHDHPFESGYQDAARDAALAAREIDPHLASGAASGRIDRLEVVRPVFFRNKGAYIVARLLSGERTIPLVLALASTDRGIVVDAVLANEDEVSILFSFSHSYFHVEAKYVRELIAFLETIMPQKPVDELYTSLGFHKHGKTVLYRSLRRHLAETDDRFELAAGDEGMVMLVFTLPSYDTVFKIIRDRFAPPKTSTAQEVMDRYRLVFRHDRVGRLVDAHEFEHLQFRTEDFTETLLEQLATGAAGTVEVEGDQVLIKHLYTERKLTPLNLFLRDAGEEQARQAVLDYGQAIKDLAAANIFPGDFLLKNFGVTRYGRVVFYDYDELCRLDDCRFRDIPPPRTPEDELESEPWFTVGDNDVFPEEFGRFLGLSEPLRALFIERHGELFTVEFWRDLQERHRAGEIIDFFPYPETRRLRR